jgi:hypothetical protein
MTPKPLFLPQKQGVLTQTYFRTIFAKFLRVRKKHIFLKNFQTSITELFRNSRKQKVWKIPSFVGPWFETQVKKL